MTRARTSEMFALRGRPPRSVEVSGESLELIKVFKHDFFAATGWYEGGDRQVVLKIGRREGFLGLPLGWIGRLLVRHEADLFRRTADLEGVPELIGVWQGLGLVHDFVPGRALWKGHRVDHAFFARLQAMIEAMHRRGMAYVDLEKPQNVLAGDDGRPYLIDFQIAFDASGASWARIWAATPILRLLQDADRYHLGKLQRRSRPDQLTADELAASYRKPWYIDAHRWLTRPATRLRRRSLERFDPERHTGERGAVP